MSYCEIQGAVASAGAVGAKAARACDGCLRRRARWFCEADDAFLCQRCDVSVHSANPLARRHRRVRLKNASGTSYSSSSASFSSLTSDMSSDDHATPSWLHGLKRKPRTPRAKPGFAGVSPAAAKVEPLVPDLEALSAEENQLLHEEEQLLYCVPILDPVLADFCSHPRPLDAANASGDEVKPPALNLADNTHVVPAAEGLAGFHPSILDLEEFASDMETLLGRGLEDDSFGMAELGLMSAAAEEAGKPQVKAEMELDVGASNGNDACDYTMELDLPKEALELGLDDGLPAIGELEEEHKLLQQQEETASPKRKILKLDYKAVVVAWSSNGCSPWMDGERPQLDLNDSWPDLSEMAGGGGGEGMYQQLAHVAAAAAEAAVGEGREARVSRYREKRRTRLFSKKIRYEVRKLNAEKRPRMKGRFVKRGTMAAAAAFPAAGAAAVASFLYR